jgi:hypothetical protein
MARARIVFRILIGLTLAVMTLGRYGGGHLPHVLYAPFSAFFTIWFFMSVAVFAAFGSVSAYHAFREPRNRQAYLTDVILAIAWAPYWLANLQRVPSLFR